MDRKLLEFLAEHEAWLLDEVDWTQRRLAELEDQLDRVKKALAAPGHIVPCEARHRSGWPR